VSINIHLARVGLVISVNREHGTGMEHIEPAPATHPVTQVGYTAVFVNADQKEHRYTHLIISADDIMKTDLGFLYSAGYK
jgi:hypothetical protein